MHYISEISIKNFKSIENSTFLLTNFTPLVGYNNAGKSNIIQAIKWFINPFSLPESAFHNIEETIEVVGTIEGITEEILSNLTPTNQTKIKKYIFFNKLKLKRIQKYPKLPVKSIELKVFDYGFGYIPDKWKPAPTGLPVALKELFPDIIEIGAMEDATDDASKFKKSNTIGKLISEIVKPIEESYSREFNNKMNSFSEKIKANGKKRLKELKKFDKEATSILSEFFPGISVVVDISVPNIKELFQNSSLKVKEDGNIRDLNEYGHGAQRSIQMSLIKYLSDIKKKYNHTTTILLIDEPELYLHPQAIEQTRNALKKLSKTGYQVVFSTHSPQMISSKDILNTLLIRKKDGKTFSKKRMVDAINELDVDILHKHKAQFELIMSLTNSSKILFSERVILVEGVTELRLLPTLYEKKTSKTLGLSRIAMIEQNSSSSTKKTMEVLKAMDLDVKAIVDLDFAFREAIKQGYLQENDISKCLDYFLTNKPSDMFLTKEGLPKNSNKWSAAKCYEWLASQEPMIPIIEKLHQKLKKENIWLWTKGAIEKHLNLKAKNEYEWMKFLNNFEGKAFGRYIKDKKVKELIEWIDD